MTRSSITTGFGNSSRRQRNDPLAQLDRAPASEAGGPVFESPRDRQLEGATAWAVPVPKTAAPERDGGSIPPPSAISIVHGCTDDTPRSSKPGTIIAGCFGVVIRPRTGLIHRQRPFKSDSRNQSPLYVAKDAAPSVKRMLRLARIVTWKRHHAGIAQWQSATLPRSLREFDSPCPLQNPVETSTVLASETEGDR